MRNCRICIDNSSVEKISKTSGNTRKERRIVTKLKGFDDTYECGSESFKKGSFIKNLIKKSVHKMIETTSKPSSYLPVVYNPVRKDFFGRTDKECFDSILEEGSNALSDREVRNWFEKYAKYYPPDTLGRDLFLDE